MTETTWAAGHETTLRERAIAWRLREIGAETAKQERGFRSDRSLAIWGADGRTAAEKREYSEAQVVHLRAELATLLAMPEDVSDDDVRSAMGVA